MSRQPLRFADIAQPFIIIILIIIIILPCLLQRLQVLLF
jgi:hypothetical protein